MSSENLDFYLDVESYKQMAPAKQKNKAAVIFHTFIAPGSPKEVSFRSLCQLKWISVFWACNMIKL